ncbi:MAG: hypothetical protein RL110_1145 [Bacteroidota bacterium]|jgi:DNA-binding ferritin-like protein (Dps family)
MSQKNNSIGMNELVDYQKKEYSKTMDRIMKFLWKCGGADAQILQYAPYSDHIKAAGIGGVVLATTVMAMIAMGFAMHTIFGENTPDGHEGNWLVTIPVALVWGLIIFNLDRFIVSTVKGDGTEKITWGEWGAMLPRLFMAVIIGLTISAPLETHIFEKEIKREWGEVQYKKSQNRADQVEGIYDTRINEIKAKLAKNDSIYKSNKVIFDSLTNQINDLQAGVGVYRGQPCNVGPGCSKHGEMYGSKKNAELIMNQSKTSRENSEKELAKLLEEKDSEKKAQMDSIKAQLPGFLDQLMMLENLSSHGETYNPVDPATKKPKIDPETNQPVMEELYGAAWAPIWLVRLLFMIVEIAPVIFKFMIWDSSYDYMKDNVAQILEAKQGISLESFPDEDNNTHRIRKNYNAERIVEVAKRQNELEKENAIHAITLYAEQERKEIEENPEAFVQNQDKPGESNETEPTPNA